MCGRAFGVGSVAVVVPLEPSTPSWQARAEMVACAGAAYNRTLMSVVPPVTRAVGMHISPAPQQTQCTDGGNGDCWAAIKTRIAQIYLDNNMHQHRR